VLKNPNEMAHFVPNLIRIGLDNLKHDPNYVQSDEDKMPDSQESDMKDDKEFEGDEYSDDDNVSWKVRRAAAKLLTAVILQYPSTLSDIYRNIAPVLISRFNEREESVPQVSPSIVLD
jgi:cullin-associated NEDD8-dissociated protein 1